MLLSFAGEIQRLEELEPFHLLATVEELKSDFSATVHALQGIPASDSTATPTAPPTSETTDSSAVWLSTAVDSAISF